VSLPEEEDLGRRQAWRQGPEPARSQGEGWLALSDDELLFRIESLGPDDDEDRSLLDIIASDRHFFVRQEAAKKVKNVRLLRDHSGDRHIGQILVRGMTRTEDADYLRRLLAESRHLEVRKAAEAQLRVLAAREPRLPLG
jgi:hypothetical protein